MLFNSLTFFVFYLVVITAYFRVPWRAQNVLILVASCFFYGSWDYRFLMLMATSVTTDFLVGKRLAACEDRRQRRLLLATSMVVNLGILGFFKYFNFFLGSFARLLETVGLSCPESTLNIVLPVGISFYTFQSMSYTIDVYRGHLKATNNYVEYAAYISFFPQLVAGPIERATHLLPQFQQPRTVSRAQVTHGLWMILWGLYKKVVIADNLAAIVDPVFSWSEPLGGAMVLVSLYVFAMQIYCDFSGYSDMAKGLAACMGFDLMHNFRNPYFSTNPQMFWTRWHVSLSTWLRDYLYISLGGNRMGRLMTYRNLLLTMFLGGLWHGAAWTFVAWGAYQGLVLVIHRLYVEIRGGRGDRVPRAGTKLLQWLVMIHVICFGWLLFRADSMFQVWTFVKILATDFSVSTRALGHLLALVCLCAPLWLVEWFQEKRQDLDATVSLALPVKAVFAAALVAMILGFGNTGTMQFIYFQF